MKILNAILILWKKKHKMLKKFLLSFIVILAFSASVAVSAYNPVSVTIITSQSSADSLTIHCTNYIDFYGVNDAYSTNDLYCELYNDNPGPDIQYYSTLLSPGTGSMSQGQVSSWHNIFYQRTLDKERDLYVHLDPAGWNSTGCHGAGKLVD